MKCLKCEKKELDYIENKRKLKYYFYFAELIIFVSCGIIILFNNPNVNSGLFAGFLFGVSSMLLAEIFDKFTESGLEID